MNKNIIRLAASLICILSLAACGQDISKEAAEKGKSYFDSGDYETAAKAFGVAIQNGSVDEEVRLLYDITLKYHQAYDAYENNKFKTAESILKSIDSDYKNYGIVEKIVTLQADITKSLNAENSLTEIAKKITMQDYESASILANSIDISALSAEQVKQLNEYKTTIVSAQTSTEETPVQPAPETTTNTQTNAEQNQTQTKPNTRKPITRKPAENKPQSKPVTKPIEKPATPAPKPTPVVPAPQPTTPVAPVQPAINTTVSTDAYIYPTDTKLLTIEQLKTLSKDDIALIRNEIYARKGHIFTTEKYQKYFSTKTWYTPTKPVLWTDFSEIEQNNIKLITEYEKSI